MTEARYLIRKSGYYYRPNSAGYTSSAIIAGRYTLEDAKSITHPNGPDGPRDGMSYHHEREIICDELVAFRIAEAEAYARGVADARRVKQLVWVELGDKWGTVTSGGMQITQKFVAPYWAISGASAESDADTFHILEDAKSAAQADYERRILSALTDMENGNG